MLERIDHRRLANAPHESPEDMPFTITVRTKFVREAGASLKSSVVTSLCVSEIVVSAGISKYNGINRGPAYSVVGTPP